MVDGVYSPPPGEYTRPSGRYLLEVDTRGSFDNHYVRGAFHHQQALARYKAGASVLLELVPEPGNPHDPWAVAFHIERERVGYVASDYAGGMHEYIAGHNRQGRAVSAQGEIRVESGDSERRVTVFLPWWRDQLTFQETSSVYSECDRLIESLDEPTRTRIMRNSQGLEPADVRTIWEKRSVAPHLVWSKRENNQIPIALRYRLIDWDRKRRDEARIIAAQEREKIRAAKAQELLETKEAKKTAKRLAREQFVESVCKLAEDGQSITAIMGILRCSDARVRDALTEANVTAVNANEASRAARLSRGREALQMQRDGFTRKEIAQTLGWGFETVVGMLKDAKFFEKPTTDPARLARARRVIEVAGTIRVADAACTLGWTTRETRGARSDAATLAFLHLEPESHIC